MIIVSSIQALTTVGIDALSPERSAMMADTTNDNDTFPLPRHNGPDAHGLAAILLVESLIHALIARSVISGEEAIDLVTVALDVKMEIAADEGDRADPMDKALALLSAIRRSLSIDIA